MPSGSHAGESIHRLVATLPLSCGGSTRGPRKPPHGHNVHHSFPLPLWGDNSHESCHVLSKTLLLRNLR